MSVARLTHLR